MGLAFEANLYIFQRFYRTFKLKMISDKVGLKSYYFLLIAYFFLVFSISGFLMISFHLFYYHLFLNECYKVQSNLRTPLEPCVLLCM